MWDTSYILMELVWTMLLLVPKLNEDTWKIGLIEVVWKVAGVVINTPIKSVVQF